VRSGIRTGPFVLRVASDIGHFAAEFERLYEPYPDPDAEFADFHVGVVHVGGARRWLRPQIAFVHEGMRPFHPFPADQAAAVFEWGLNWTIASTAHQFLMIHAAVVARDDAALILPGTPGAGKSTLAAALAWRGWRLLSDEIALVVPGTATIHPLARPISLKNESIEIIRRRAPDALFGSAIEHTHKGRLALLRPPAESVASMLRPATARWLVFPRFSRGAPAELRRKSRAAALYSLAQNAFNYEIHGAGGFETLADLVSRTSCHELEFRDLDGALAAIDEIAR